jgi:hypothetical protein
MSKSLKNFVTIRELLKNHTADQFRMFCFQYKYRSNVHFSAGGLIPPSCRVTPAGADHASLRCLRSQIE